MPDYTRSIIVDASAGHVFSFISTISNLPKYLPTVRTAEAQDGDRVAVDGVANGHSYHNDGYFKIDKDAGSMSWGSDGENDYGGRMEVHAAGEAASKVTCTLHFNPKPELSAAMGQHQGGHDAAITDGLEASLNSIKNECEGVGGKQPTQADH